MQYLYKDLTNQLSVKPKNNRIYDNWTSLKINIVVEHEPMRLDWIQQVRNIKSLTIIADEELSLSYQVYLDDFSMYQRGKQADVQRIILHI